MRRREFLFSSSTLIGAGLVGVPGHVHAHAAFELRPVWLRLDERSQRFLPVERLPTGEALQVARLHLDGFHPVPGSRVAALRVEALTGPAAAPWAFDAWRYRRDEPLGNSRTSSFLIGADSFKGLRLGASESGGASLCSSRCSSPFTQSPLQAGRYLLVLDDGRLDSAGFAFTRDWSSALELSIDHFRVRIEAVVEQPDLGQRADLACLAQADALAV